MKFFLKMGKFIWKIGKKQKNVDCDTDIVGLFNCDFNIYYLLDNLIDSNCPNSSDKFLGDIVRDYYSNMPSPSDEGFYRMENSLACACESTVQLLKWFNFSWSIQLLDLMQKHNIMLYKFKAKTVFRGKHQVIYKKETVVEIEEFQLNYLNKFR